MDSDRPQRHLTCGIAPVKSRRTCPYAPHAFARQGFAGWHYCGPINAPYLIGRKQARSYSGVLDGYGEPYPALQEALSACAIATANR